MLPLQKLSQLLVRSSKANLYLDLLVGRDGTEDDLCEALSWKHPEADAADDASVFDEGEGLVLSVDVSDVSRERRRPLTRGPRTATYGSNTSRVMYSLGMRGNW